MLGVAISYALLKYKISFLNAYNITDRSIKGLVKDDLYERSVS